METTIQKHPHTAFLAVLAPYLAAGIEVESRGWGRGILLGLPYCAPWKTASVDASFTYTGSDAVASGVVEVRTVKPVLWHAEDRLTVVLAMPSSQRTAGHFGIVNHEVEELEKMARIVDTARALGIALNLPEGSYVRKEVARG